MGDGIGLAEALVGLSGFSVLEVTEADAEVVIVIETVGAVVGCGECGTRAEAQDRMPVEIRDLACFGRPPAWWHKRTTGSTSRNSTSSSRRVDLVAI